MLRIPLGKQDRPAFATASAFGITSAGQVGEAGRINRIYFEIYVPIGSFQAASNLFCEFVFINHFYFYLFASDLFLTRN
jgi:hypothetical protein